MDLRHLVDLVHEKWQFNETNYPELQDATEMEIRRFAVRHVVLRQMKSLGEIAALCEIIDHGGQVGWADFEDAIVKMLLNSVQLTGLIGLSSESLETLIEDWAADRVRYIQYEDPRTGEPLYRPVQE